LAAKEYFGYTVNMAENISDFGIRLNYWFLTNRQQFRKWWVILLLAGDIFILTTCITQGLLLIIRFRDAGNALINITETTKQIGKAQAVLTPKNLSQSMVATTPHGLVRFDFSLRLENPNDYWLATATVQFEGGKNKLTPVQVIVPPKSVRFAMALDVEPITENQVPKVTYSIIEVKWEKLSLVQIAEYNLDVKTEKLTQTQAVLMSRDNTQRLVTQVKGDLTNKSFFNLEGLRIAIVLTNGQETIGVRSAIISKVASESTVPFSVEWDTVLLMAQKIEAYPELHSGLIVK